MTKIFLLDRINSSETKKKKAKRAKKSSSTEKELQKIFSLHYRVSVTSVDLTPLEILVLCWS